MLKKNIITYIILGCLIFTGCSGRSATEDDTAQEPVSEDVFAMDTYMTVTAYGKNAQNAVDEAVDEIERLDALLSTGDKNSEVSSLNNNGGGKVSDDTKYLISRSLDLWKETNGKFDITIYPIMQSWGFTDKNFTVPSSEVLSQLLTLVDSSAIKLNEKKSTIAFEKEGLKIDLGGIAKGYTSSRIMDIFRKNGVTKGLVSLGGNVQVLGRKTDDDLWRVAIQDPDGTDYLGVLQAEDCAVITSGGYERYFEQDGVTYHHIIDPATGYPANNGLKSVTIVSEDGTLADGLSTSLFIMGKDQAVDFWQKHSDEFDMILVDDNSTIYVSEGIAEHFSSDKEVQIVKREG